jgi:hypothetical protein
MGFLVVVRVPEVAEVVLGPMEQVQMAEVALLWQVTLVAVVAEATVVGQ